MAFCKKKVFYNSSSATTFCLLGSNRTSHLTLLTACTFTFTRMFKCSYLVPHHAKRRILRRIILLKGDLPCSSFHPEAAPAWQSDNKSPWMTLATLHRRVIQVVSQHERPPRPSAAIGQRPGPVCHGLQQRTAVGHGRGSDSKLWISSVFPWRTSPRCVTKQSQQRDSPSPSALDHPRPFNLRDRYSGRVHFSYMQLPSLSQYWLSKYPFWDQR